MSSKSEIGIRLSLAGAQQVEAGLRKVGGSVSDMEGALNAARQSLLSLVPAFGAAMAVGGVTHMMTAVRETASEIERLAVLAGSTPQEFQRFAAGAKSVNIDMEKFASIMKDTQDKLGDFLQTGGGELKDFFEKIAPKVGVTAEQFKNLSGPQALQLFYNSLQKANLSQKETVFWMESIADDATLLAPLLANNGAEFERLGNKAAATGTLMSDYLLSASRDLTQQTNALDDQFKSAGNTIAEQLFPALTETARTLVDFNSNGELAGVVADGIRTAFETVVIVGANVAYVIKQTGVELGGLAAQAAAVARLDFKGAGSIGEMMKSDAAAARAELDAFEQRILNAGKNSKAFFAVTQDLKKAKFGSDEFIKSVEQLAGMQNRGAISADQLAAAFRGLEPASKSAVRGVSGMGVGAEAAKKAAEAAKKAADELKKSYQSALDGAASQARDLTAESENLNAAEKKLADIIASPAWEKWNATQRETVRTLFQRNSATIKAQELAKADEKWAQESRASNLAFAESALEAAASAEEQAYQQRLANEALGLTGIALSGLEAARLDDAAAEKTRLAAIMDGIDPSIAESYRRQAAALTDLAQAKREGAVKQAGVDAAQEAKDAWDKTASKIEQSLTDALMRGFESGKDFGKNLVDTLKNMFSTLVLRPVIQAVINPVASTLTAAMGLPGAASAGQAGQGINPMSLASSANSAYSLLTTGIRDSIANGFTKLASSNLGQRLGLYDADAGVRGLTGTGQSISSGLQSAGGSMMAYGLSKGLSGGYRVGNGKIMDAATLVAGWFDPTGGLIAGAVSAAINRAFGRKLADSGLQGTFGGDAGFSGGNYEFYKGGWFRSDKTKTSALDSQIETALADQFRALQTSTGLMATTLGLGTEAISSFTSSIKLSFQGLTEEQIQTKLAEEFGKLGESLASTALGTERYTRTGETAAQTMQRLSSSLSTVNGTFDVLGRTLYAASLSSADMASQLVDLFGGIDTMTAQTAAYYQAFYSEAERNATATRQLTASLAALGLSLPTTRDTYRSLVEAQDLSTDAGRRTYAALLGLSAQFDSITPKLDTLAGKFSGLITGLADEATQLIDSQIQLSQGAARAARDVANDYRAAMTDLRSAAESILLQRAGGLQSARAAYQVQLARAQGGDVKAMQALPGLADALLVEAKGSSRTAAQFAIASAQVANQLEGVAAVADVLGVGADYQAKLFDVNTSLLEVTRDQLASGNLTVDLLGQIQAALGKVDSSIQASANLTVGTMQTGNGGIMGALVDNAGAVVAGLDSNTVLQLVGLQNQNAAAAAQAQAMRAAMWGTADWQRQAAYDINGSQHQLGWATADAVANRAAGDASWLSGQLGGALWGTADWQRQAAYDINGSQHQLGWATADAVANRAAGNTSWLSGQIGGALWGTADWQRQAAYDINGSQHQLGWATADAVANRAAGNTSWLSGQIGGALWGTADWQRQAAYDVNNSQWSAAYMLNGTTAAQTVSLGGLTQQQIGQLQALGSTQSKTLGLTDIVASATDGSETLLSKVLNRLSAQDSGSADIVGALKSGNVEMLTRLGGIEAALRQQSAAQAAELQRQKDLAAAQDSLKQLAGQQQSTIAAVNDGISSIWALAKEYGIDLYQNSGAAASFAVGSDGLFSAAYDYISKNAGNWNLYKNDFYASGGVYDQTYGRAGELQSLASKIQAERDLIVSLGGVPGFSVGGYTGFGAKDEPAGIVHRGEIVWSQDDVVRAGGVQAVESLRLGRMPGYADGGVVDVVPALQTWLFPAALAATAAGTDDRHVQALVDEVRALRHEVEGLRAEARATAVNTGRTQDLMKRVTSNGKAMQTESFS